MAGLFGRSDLWSRRPQAGRGQDGEACVKLERTRCYRPQGVRPVLGVGSPPGWRASSATATYGRGGLKQAEARMARPAYS
jgi:hypothetical protein